MTVPVVSGSSWLFPTSTAATSHSVPLPCSSVGDLLVLCVSSTNAATVTSAGWTQLLAVNRPAAAGQDRLTVLTRTSDGTEGASVTISLSGTENAAAICFAVDGAGTPDYTTATSSVSSVPDPPSHTPSAGSQQYLWIAICVTSGARWLTGYPSGFGVNPVTLYFGSASTARTSMAAACLVETASVKDPGTFAISGTFDWAAATIAIPVTGPTGGTPTTFHPLKSRALGPR